MIWEARLAELSTFPSNARAKAPGSKPGTVARVLRELCVSFVMNTGLQSTFPVPGESHLESSHGTEDTG
jgi:hypothetical protein